MPPPAELERCLALARVRVPGTGAELAALVELASRMVCDQQRRYELATEGADLAARLGDETAEVRCRAMIAEFVARRENPADALPGALATLAVAERTGDPLAMAQAHHTVGHCFFALDCTAEAFEHVQQGLVGYRRAGDVFGEGRVLGFMASLYTDLGEDDRAFDYYQQACELFLHCDDSTGAGVMFACLSGIRRRTGDPVTAVAFAERALEQFELAGAPLDAMIGMQEYAEVLSALGKLDLAELWVKRAAERNRMPDGTLVNPSYEADLLMITARAVQIPRGDLAAARATLASAVELANELKTNRMAADAEAMLADVLHDSGDPVAAYVHLKRSSQLNQEATRSSHDRRVRALRVRFEVEHAQREASRYRERARAQAEMIAELERTKAELAIRMADLERLNAEVVQLSRTDPLTGIANRRSVTDSLLEFTRLTARHATPLAVAIVDVDRFKGINDRYGHGVGDAVLMALSQLMRSEVRVSDVPARLGGDEFVIIMPDTTPEAAVTACRRLQNAVRQYPWETIAPDLTVRITVGLADGTGQSDPDEILLHADAALYRGKRAGRDTVAG